LATCCAAHSNYCVYGDLLRAKLTDELAFIAENSHSRVITEDMGASHCE